MTFALLDLAFSNNAHAASGVVFTYFLASPPVRRRAGGGDIATESASGKVALQYASKHVARPIASFVLEHLREVEKGTADGATCSSAAPQYRGHTRDHILQVMRLPPQIALHNSSAE